MPFKAGPTFGTKIAKPEGQPGRPNSGGYNLEAKLGWDHRTFKSLEVCSFDSIPSPAVNFRFKSHVWSLVEENLDVKRAYLVQSDDQLNIVRELVCIISNLLHSEINSYFKAVNKFPDLDNYEKLWPLNAMIQMLLKKSSSRYRQKKNVDAGIQAQKAAVRGTRGNNSERAGETSGSGRNMRGSGSDRSRSNTPY